MRMKNEVYDVLKNIALIVIPAAVTCWIAIGNIWNLPYVEEIAGTATAIATFLGALLKISSDKYNGPNELTVEEVEHAHAVEMGDMDEEAK